MGLFNRKNKRASGILKVFSADLDRVTRASIDRELAKNDPAFRAAMSTYGFRDNPSDTLPVLREEMIRYMRSKVEASTHRRIVGSFSAASAAASWVAVAAVIDAGLSRSAAMIANSPQGFAHAARAIRDHAPMALWDYATHAAAAAHPILSAMGSNGAIGVAIGASVMALSAGMATVFATSRHDSTDAATKAVDALIQPRMAAVANVSKMQKAHMNAEADPDDTMRM